MDTLPDFLYPQVVQARNAKLRFNGCTRLRSRKRLSCKKGRLQSNMPEKTQV